MRERLGKPRGKELTIEENRRGTIGGAVGGSGLGCRTA
ncbi:Protein of unknown function [Gryllus bimaculatus]|nr:Protein of unknown function [Gryllus bimaculatus]